MKTLRLMGMGGIKLTEIELDVKGENVVIAFPIPIYYPLEYIVLEDIEEVKNEAKTSKPE